MLSSSLHFDEVVSEPFPQLSLVLVFKGGTTVPVFNGGTPEKDVSYFSLFRSWLLVVVIEGDKLTLRAGAERLS